MAETALSCAYDKDRESLAVCIFCADRDAFFFLKKWLYGVLCWRFAIANIANV